ncbi:hypothetical protein FS837_010269 [Tulasnella sp. UAMH 9824]|nr:hypothetical protein FS837_010269 [Tulasnella sp. UAMH 9824]
MKFPITLLSLLIITGTNAQRPGTLTAEVHPPLTWQLCNIHGCLPEVSGRVVLDANWRWYHRANGSTNCFSGNQWDATICPDPATCNSNCVLEGANYSGTYGITSLSGARGIALKWKQGQNVGSRVHVLRYDTQYELFKLLNQEIAFDVDVSKVPCGIAASAQLTEMAADGGMSSQPGNTAGAKYGVGYCDSRCPKDLKWIGGEVNNLDWTPISSTSGVGRYGSCCNEVDLFQGNSISSAFTVHSCSSPTVAGQYRCTGTECGTTANPTGGVCDPVGCDYNAYRNGQQNFYGPSKTIDTTKKFTVVTRFITDTGTATGTLTEIRRLWVQDGVVIQNASVNVAGISTANSISTGYCAAKETVFGDPTSFEDHGGLGSVSGALNRGMVLTFSIWDDPAAHLLWLDSNYPAGTSPTQAGVARGTCPTSSGDPAVVEANEVDASVTFSWVRVGPIGTTYELQKWEQCGGVAF